MITLTLLHPVQGTAVQSWTFQHDQNVRIGRAVDNEVVLYSAVVSRHHVELRHEKGGWHVHNIGINGTFLEGNKIESEPLKSGQIIRLARSGPNIQVLIESPSSEQVPKPVAGLSADVASSNKPLSRGTHVEPRPGSEAELVEKTPSEPDQTDESAPCNHERSPQSSLICVECGEPMQVLHTVGAYKILKSLSDRQTTFQAWKNKKTYILRTAPAQIFCNPDLVNAYFHQLQRAETLNHGGIPRMIEVLESDGQTYLVYEMVYGTSLESWVSDRGVLSLPSAISWITEIARIVEYLHQLAPPFIHQGISPKNIIRPTIPQGTHSLMLVNFGQFHHLLPCSDQRDTDLPYRAPHLDCTTATIDLDLYGLGASFLFMLTGSDPYKFMQLGDHAYGLELDDTHDIPAKALDIIKGLLQIQSSTPIKTVTEAIDRFVHLI